MCETKLFFLTYEIEDEKIKPDNESIESIKKLKPTTNVKELQRFLCSVNAYYKFIDKYATIQQPLNHLLKKNIPWEWSKNMSKIF